MYNPVYLQSGVEPGDETRVSFSRVQSLGFNPYTDFVVAPFHIFEQTIQVILEYIVSDSLQTGSSQSTPSLCLQG